MLIPMAMSPSGHSRRSSGDLDRSALPPTPHVLLRCHEQSKPAHKATLTRFPGERPDVAYYPSCQRGVPNPIDFSDSVSASGWRAFQFEIH
jgi:hypothetical protein